VDPVVGDGELIGAWQPLEVAGVVPGDEVWRRIVGRDLEGRWKPRLITREELEEWSRTYDRPTDEEMAADDSPG